MRLRSRFGVALFAALAALVAAPACRAPTEITIEVSTDVKCSDVRGTAVTIGDLSTLDAKPATTQTPACDPSTGRIGSMVIVPSGAKDDIVAIKLVMGVGRDPAECVPPAYGPGCIVARRALHFIPSSSLFVPIFMAAVCSGIPCDATQTCTGGNCASATIIDSSKCEEPGGCTEGSLGRTVPGDAGGGSDVADAGGGGGVLDARVDADGAARPATCDANDPTLRLCYRFENSVVDESAPPVSPLLTTNLTFVPGRNGSAVRLSPAPPTDLQIANTAKLRTPQVTFEMWFYAVSLPTTGRYMLLDLHDEVGVMIDPGGVVRCRAPDIVAPTLAKAGTWTHVACAFDGTIMRMYLNGVYQAEGASAYGANLTAFTGIGQESPTGLDRFDGLVDDLRIWSTARTAAQIAAAATP